MLFDKTWTTYGHGLMDLQTYWQYMDCITKYAGIIFCTILRYFHIFLQEIASKFPEWEKKSYAEFFSFRAVKFLFCICGSFRDYQTVLFDWFLNYCGAKFITHTTAGNHSLICIIEKLYRKNSLSVSVLSKRFFYRYLKSAKTCPRREKKIIRPKAVQSGWQHVKVSYSSTTQLDWSGHALLLIWMTIKHKMEQSLMNNNPTPKPMKPLFSCLHFVTSQA